MTEIALAISLWVTACIDGTLHGQPKTLCREFQIRAYDSVEACNSAHDQAVAEWLKGMEPYQLDLHLMGSRCAPAERHGDDP